MTFAVACLLVLSTCEKKLAEPLGDPQVDVLSFDAAEDSLAKGYSVSLAPAWTASTVEVTPAFVADAQQRAIRVMVDGALVHDAVTDLGDQVKHRRFRRLNSYALRSGWDLEEPPLEGGSQVQVWWQEWRELYNWDRQQQMAASSVWPQGDIVAPEAKASAP